MKKPEQFKISGKAPSMSQYLLTAHQRLSIRKDPQILPTHKLSRNSQPKHSLIVKLENQPDQFKERKAQRSFSDAIFLRGIMKRGLSLQKINLEQGTDNLKASETKSIKGRQSSSHAQAIVLKWRNSISGMELLKKRKSSHVSSSNYLFLKLQENEKRKSSMVPRQPSTQSMNNQPHRKKPPPLSLSKNPSVKNTRKLYNSIRQYNREQQFWLFHLKQELSLKQVIEEFQKIELNRNVQPSKKLTMRQAYQLKKEIVFQIQQEKSQSIQANIEKLAQMALDEKEKDKFLMIGFFIVLRHKLKREQQQQLNDEQSSQSPKPSVQAQSEFIYQEQLISEIKQEISRWKRYKFEDANIINIKILSILALHIIKLQSPTFSFQDLQLISRTIRLKKKGQTIIDYLSDEDKIVHFQSLIYVIFQFYKNLYYLKLDEQMKIEQYNSLKAYIQLYEARDPTNFQKFEDRYKISATIDNIKPASVGIYPYQDSRIRNQIMFRTLQKELHNESSDEAEGGSLERKPKIKINKKTLITHMNEQKKQQCLKDPQSDASKDQVSRSDLSSQRDSSRMQSKAEVSEVPSHNTMQSDFNRKLCLKKQVTPSKKKVSLRTKYDDTNNLLKKTSHELRLDRSKRAFNNRSIVDRNEQKIKRLREKQPFVIDQNNFKFQFVLVKQTRLFSGNFHLTPTTTNTTLKMKICLKDHNCFPVVNFTFSNIRVIPETQTKSSFQKFMWKVFKRIFVVNFMSEEDPFLMKEYNQDPQHMKIYNQEKPIDSEFRLLQVIHDYLIYWMKKQPYAHNFTGVSLERPAFNPEQINKYMQNLEYEHDRKMFQKRYGYLDSKSGRRTGYSPGKASRIVFSEIRNEFYVDQGLREHEKEQRMIKLVKNVLFLVKVNMSDRVEMKFVNMLFLKHIRQISIFQQGLFKHTGTLAIHEKIPTLRKLKNHSSLNRNRLIQQLQCILTFSSPSYPSPDSQFDDLMLNKSFHIEQQFEVDLTNEFKFIPSIEMQFVYEVKMKDFQVVMIREERLKRQKSKGLVRKKIENDFILGLQSQQSRQNNEKKHRTTGKIKFRQTLTTFKISLCLFLTATFHFTWGTRHLTLNKNMQFFSIKPHTIIKDLKFSYQIDAISLYKIPIMIDPKIQTFESDDRKYYYCHVRKPFLSKLNTLIVLGKTKSQESVKRFGEGEKSAVGSKGGDTEAVLMQQLHFIEQKLYVRLKKQKMLKFRIEKKSSYFLLQMYQTIQATSQSFLQACSLDHCHLFIYQLTDLKNPQVKYFLTLEQQIAFEDSCNLKQLIDISKLTLKGQQMEMFEIPVQKINFQNEFFEKKTKNVRKKVISEANYFFQERVLAICNNLKNQNILINVLHKYRVSKRQKFKFS